MRIISNFIQFEAHMRILKNQMSSSKNIFLFLLGPGEFEIDGF